MIETDGELSGRRLRPDELLPFRCHPGLACFNSCCRNKRLTLLPYDVLRISRHLGCRSDEFLGRHVELEIESSSGWPTLRIKLQEDGRCPFVGSAGCGVYPDRPTCCRIYPLARAVSVDGGEPRELYVAPSSTDKCMGFGEPGTFTVEGWTRDQGLEPYRAANNRTARLLLHPRRPRPLSLSSAQVHAVVLALYNLDVFRDALRQPAFAERCGVEPTVLERALSSDQALLDFGQDWLTAQLFG